VKAITTLAGSAIICGAAPNSTIASSINLIGLTTVDGQCSGTQCPYGTWDKVVVHATIRFILGD